MNPPTPDVPGSRGPRVRDYVRRAFLYPWNLLFFLGGVTFAALSPWPDAMLPLIGGLELTYLTALMAHPRFRTAVEAQVAREARERDTGRASEPGAQLSLQGLLGSLPPPSLRRFLLLRQRCTEMRDIASGVRGQAQGNVDSAESIRTPALDRLLFLFLRLLVSQDGLDRFMKSTSEGELVARAADVKKRLEQAQGSGDERVARSLQDSLADAELRLDNYRKSAKDAEFVSVELDRIETKIQALVEMAVSRHDSEALSTQVTAAAESMQHTEDAVNQLQNLTGLADQVGEPPPILEADLGGVMLRHR